MKQPEPAVKDTQWTIRDLMLVVLLLAAPLGVYNLLFYESQKFVSTPESNFFTPIKIFGSANTLFGWIILSKLLLAFAFYLNYQRLERSYAFVAYFLGATLIFTIACFSKSENFWKGYQLLRPAPIFLVEGLFFMIAEGLYRKLGARHWSLVAICTVHFFLFWWIGVSYVLLL